MISDPTAAVHHSTTLSVDPDFWFRFAERFGFPAALVLLLIVVIVVLFRWFAKEREDVLKAHAKEREEQDKRHEVERDRSFKTFNEMNQAMLAALREHHAIEVETQNMTRGSTHELVEIRKSLDVLVTDSRAGRVRRGG